MDNFGNIHSKTEMHDLRFMSAMNNQFLKEIQNQLNSIQDWVRDSQHITGVKLYTYLFMKFSFTCIQLFNMALCPVFLGFLHTVICLPSMPGSYWLP